MEKTVVIIGGGAAGFFAAVNLAEGNRDLNVILLERSAKTLQKVKVSGGGRCNVTHACFEPRELVKFYPRGEKALRGPFSRFQPGDTIAWFADRDIPLKVEDDNRMFPESNTSQTIVDCLYDGAINAGVDLRLSQKVEQITPPSEEGAQWTLQVNGASLAADAVMIATGSAQGMWKELARIGHQIVPPVPSLFTFNIKDPRIDGLMGLATPAEIKVEGTKLKAHGPTLITHWGMSGPGILRLSSWGARELAERQYRFVIRVNWTISENQSSMLEELKEKRAFEPKKKVRASGEFDLPKRLWHRQVEAAGITEDLRWADVSNKQLNKLSIELTEGRFEVNGKSTFKEEFVTCGGVDLKEVDFKRMESKLFPNLYFAGEVLNIDAITGGFNFQAAWTGAWIVAQSMLAQFED